MIKMAYMSLKIPLSRVVVLAAFCLAILDARPTFAASPAIDIATFRAQLAGLPRDTLRAARTGSPDDCLEAVARFLHDQPRRPAPWVAFRAQSACAIQAGDKEQALTASNLGLGLRGSDSDLLVLKALGLAMQDTSAASAVDPKTQEAYIDALTEALVFDRFTGMSRLDTLLLLANTLNDLSQSNRAVSILELWIEREPNARGALIDMYAKAGNRPKALEVSQKYISKGDADQSIVRARARALLLATDRVLNKADFQEALLLLKPLATLPDSILRAQALLKLNRPADALKEIANNKSNEAEALREQARIEVEAQNRTH